LTVGLTQVVQRPALNLLILGLVLLSLTFHECGHVAACRYGGARPGNMGIGLYLVWPAFYSTVTDAYRLNRVGRLRTDLGGVYFNVLFLTGTALTYLRTGEPWLLVAVLALHTETAWQFLPSIRLDGYYMLADLVGVPDLFSYIGPVLKSLVPGRAAHPRVRELRRWSRRVIVLWVSLIIPVLLVYLLAFLLALPRSLGVLGSAVLEYRGTVEAALTSGDVPTVTLSMFQLFLLLLPWAGFLLLAATLLRTLARAAVTHWGWTWHSPALGPVVRGGAAVATVVFVAAAAVWRVAVVAGMTPPGGAEARIMAGALGVVRLGPARAPGVAPGEVAVREQLVAYARLTGAFDRHAHVLAGARELVVLACAVLVLSFLALGLALRWRWWALVIPLVGVTAMGPAVSVLATLGPGVVGAAWTAAGITLLILGVGERRARHYRPRPVLCRAFVVLGGAALAAGVATEPLLAAPSRWPASWPWCVRAVGWGGHRAGCCWSSARSRSPPSPLPPPPRCCGCPRRQR
jgi:putative peptide zinc metalloprotease protein